MDKQSAEIYADFLVGQGLTSLEVSEVFPKNLLSIWILRGYEIRRFDSLKKSWYQNEEVYTGFGVGYGEGNGYGLVLNKDPWRGHGQGISQINTPQEEVYTNNKLGSGLGEGKGPLPGNWKGHSEDPVYHFFEARRVRFPLFAITQTPTIPLAEIAQRRLSI